MINSKFVGIIGNVLDEYEKTPRELCLTTITIRGVEYPLVGEKHLLSSVSGKVQIEGVVKSEKKYGRLFTFIHSTTISKAEDDAVETSYVQVEGYLQKRITSISRLSVDFQAFILSYKNGGKGATILHSIAKGKLAKYISKVEDGSKLKIGGILQAKERTLVVKVTEIIH